MLKSINYLSISSATTLTAASPILAKQIPDPPGNIKGLIKVKVKKDTKKLYSNLTVHLDNNMLYFSNGDHCFKVSILQDFDIWRCFGNFIRLSSGIELFEVFQSNSTVEIVNTKIEL